MAESETIPLSAVEVDGECGASNMERIESPHIAYCGDAYCTDKQQTDKQQIESVQSRLQAATVSPNMTSVGVKKPANAKTSLSEQFARGLTKSPILGDSEIVELFADTLRKEVKRQLDDVKLGLCRVPSRSNGIAFRVPFIESWYRLDHQLTRKIHSRLARDDIRFELRVLNITLFLALAMDETRAYDSLSDEYISVETVQLRYGIETFLSAMDDNTTPKSDSGSPPVNGTVVMNYTQEMHGMKLDELKSFVSKYDYRLARVPGGGVLVFEKHQKQSRGCSDICSVM